MDDRNQNPEPGPGSPPPVYPDWREQRRAERQARREERRERRGRYGWVGGAALILLGVLILLQNMGVVSLQNWWALFLLIPAFWSFAAAWENYQEKGQITRRAAWSLTVGVVLTLLSGFFLLNLTLGPYWPFLLIIAGIVLLGTAFLPE